MTKRQIFAGMMAAILVTGIAVVDAQGRRGPAGQLGPRPGIQGQVLGGRGERLLGAPVRGFAGRMGRGGRMGGGPLAGLRAVGLTDDQKARLKTILAAARAEQLAAREKTNAAVLAILTPEQRAKLGGSGK